MESLCQYPGCTTKEEYLIRLDSNVICSKCLYEFITRTSEHINPFTKETLSIKLLEDLEKFVTITRYYFIVVNTTVKPFFPGRSLEITLTWFATVGDLVVSIYSHFQNPSVILFTRLKLENETLITQDIFQEKCSTLDNVNKPSTLKLVAGICTYQYLLALRSVAISRSVFAISNFITHHLNL